MMEEISDYKNAFEIIRRRVYQARHKAFHTVNKELISLYWDLGKIISEKQEKEGWGQSTVGRLSKDLEAEFPGVSGFSKRNLFNMKAFYLAYKNCPKVQPLAALIPWTHNVTIITKVKDEKAREFYLRMILKEGWSKRTLEGKIKFHEYEKYLQHQNNFPDTLEKAHLSKLNWEFKDEYNLTFLNLRDEFLERDLEQSLVDNICKLLSEMGGDFCFVGQQFKVKVGETDFFIDLLFYHRGLKSLIAVELKTGKFKPEHVGKIEFYLTALDEDVRKEDENPSIGIIICQSKDRTVVEYALKNKNKPIGISTFQYKELPENISKYLPSDEEITKRLSGRVEFKS